MNRATEASTARKEQMERREKPRRRRTDSFRKRQPTAGWLGSPSGVSVVESANHRELDDLPLVRWLNGSRIRGIFPESQMRPEAVIVREVTPNKSAQVLLVEHHHVIEAVSA